MVQELFRAVASNDATAIRSLVARHGPGMLEARNAAGMRAVEVALERGQRRAYRELERHGRAHLLQQLGFARTNLLSLTTLRSICSRLEQDRFIPSLEHSERDAGLVPRACSQLGGEGTPTPTHATSATEVLVRRMPASDTAVLASV